MAAGAVVFSGAAGAASGDPFEGRDATELASLVAGKQVTAAELLDFAIKRLERVNPQINALALRHEDKAREQLAGAPLSGPFAGVPFLIKDNSTDLAGTETTNGSRFFKGNLRRRDSEIVVRFKRAGLVIFGKTTSPELALTNTTESVLYGATRNPWALDRTAGGSSGGAAAVVAARVLPVAHGSDGGGSIRTPASCCGVFGLKPTRGRVPMGPDRFEGWNGLSAAHALTLTVRDSAALLDAIAGPELGAPYFAPPIARPYAEEAKRDPSSLRIALMRAPLSGVPVHDDCIAAVESAARLLESLGHKVEEASPPLEWGPLGEALGYSVTVATLKALQDRGAALGRRVTRKDVEFVTWRLAEDGRDITGLQYAQARAAFDSAGRTMAEFQQRYDVVMSPTCAKPPVPLELVHLSPPTFEQYVREVHAFAPFTALHNFTGQPSMSVPLHWNAAGLPIGVMFAARFGDEATLFRLAGQLERARPWRDKRPPIAA